ncbi:hypothetical protein ES332_A02G139900v1 [Gossypium tomentosum]|uniref:Uncharacterized protein n=1 Tax=Gossypium tomentosum TaxID=34277 RepID=A0A5D2RGW6_GOSTO|nr:hypothetical protein ES332_A02G139900v1 [Gossypium tomentosum]
MFIIIEFSLSPPGSPELRPLAGGPPFIGPPRFPSRAVTDSAVYGGRDLKGSSFRGETEGNSRRSRWLGLLSWIRISADAHLCTDDHKTVSFEEISASKEVLRSEVRPSIMVHRWW